MKKKNQVSIIKEAFAADIPDDKDQWPEYYRIRMDICAACDKNTANGAIGGVGKFSARKIGAQCSVCWCFINRKCWSKNEACGLAEVEGETPKWNRIVMETSSSDLFDIENLSYDLYNIDLSDNGHEFVINLGDHERDDEVIFGFRVIPKDEGLRFNGIHMCGCMASKTSIYDGSIMDFQIKLVNPINVGPYNRLIVVDYLDDKSIDSEGNPKKHSCILRVLANIHESDDKKQEDDQETNTGA